MHVCVSIQRSVYDCVTELTIIVRGGEMVLYAYKTCVYLGW
jgi:hypothetical protein